ncbi:MAG TPA: hypothetical protein VI455_10240 [Terriglobia bacterium]
MSLYGDVSSGVDTGSVTTDLFTISWNDGQLGQGPDTTIPGSMGGITSIPVAPATYPSVTTGMATANRLLELVNTTSGADWADPIVITGLAGGNDPYMGNDITGNGQTYIDTGVTPNVIHVVYDTSQDGGQGIDAFDTAGNPIQTPNAVILYHELSHAYHYALGQIPFPQTACPGNTTDEPAAEIDENVMRAELGLCLRDVCNHSTQPGWGATCGGRATPDGPPLPDGSAGSGGGGGGGGGGGCFIVTAAMGTATTFEVLRLRGVRNRLTARTGISRRLIDAVYAEYLQFSPAIAAQIAPDPAARLLVRQLVVQPLFAWFTLAERLAFRHADQAKLLEAAEAIFAACPPAAAQLVVPVIESLLADASVSAGLPGWLGAFAPGLDAAQQQPFVRWALLLPLREAWTVGSRRGDLFQAVANWLALAPIEKLDPPSSRSLDRELKHVAAFFDFAPPARRVLGLRLAAAWPATSVMLQRHGFI